MTVRGYTLAFDWSRTGTYAGVLEDATSYVLDDPVITVAYGRERSDATTDTGSGQLQVALRNDGGWFSPENTTSPIAGRVVPGVPVRYDKLLNGTLYTLLTGVLDELEVDLTRADRAFTATVLDAWGQPGAEQLSTPLYSGIRTGTAIGLVLDAIGWTGGRDLDPGATVIPWWWEEGADAATAVSKIVASEGPPAIAYVQGGTFVFRDRQHRLLRDQSTTSAGTFTHTIPEGSGPAGSFRILKDSFRYDHGLRNIANSVTFSVDQREPGDGSEVWSTDTPITLAAGETTTIEVSGQDPFFNAITPTNGAGIDLLYGSVTATLSRTSGQSVLLTLTAGGVAAQITRLALTATPVTVARTVKVAEEDTSSVNTYRRQAWSGEVPWAGPGDARAIAQRIVATYATPRPTVSFSITNLDDSYLTQILARKISDRVTVRNDALGFNRDMVIERIEHAVKKHGIPHTATFTCEITEPVQPSNVLTFDVPGKGFNQGAFGVSGIDNASSVFRFDVPGAGFDQGRFAT